MLYCVKYIKRELDDDGNIIRETDEKTYGIGGSCNEAVDFAISHKGFENTANIRYCNFVAFIAGSVDGPYRLYNAYWKTPKTTWLADPFYIQKTQLVIGRNKDEALQYAQAYTTENAYDIIVDEIPKICGVRYDFLPEL